MRTLALLWDRLTARPTTYVIAAITTSDHSTGRPRLSACRGNCRRQRARHSRFGQNAPMSVAIVMGSASDASIMDDAVQILRFFGVAVEVRVISAHRTPDDTIEFARTASANGIKVIIAAAGGAAHLAGVLAAATPLPVIGVPIALGNLGGLDSLLAMVQMPKGVPVAVVAVNGARNAGLLAVRIMALSDERLAAEQDRFRKELAEQVRDQDAEIVARYND
jgi:5-(carboxyamino)imidazole ribonucleotide mutase